MGASLCGLHESNVFGARAFSMGACHVFPQVVLAVIPLIQGVIGGVVTRACTGCWAGPPLCSVVVKALSGTGSLPSCWSRSPQICLWAAVWGRWDWSTSTGRGVTEYSSAGAVHQEVRSVVLSGTHCARSQSTLLLTLPSGPPQLWECRTRCPQALCSQSHQHRSTGTDLLMSGTGTHHSHE